MLLRKLTPGNYCGFSDSVDISFERDVTVLTGPNDTGKTSILRLIAHMCEVNSTMSESEHNVDNAEDNQPWNTDPAFGAIAEFAVTSESFKRYVRHPATQPPESIRVVCKMCPSGSGRYIERLEINKQVSTDVPVAMPKAAFLLAGKLLGDAIALDKPSTLERQFLDVAFGATFSMEKFKGYSAGRRETALENAQDKLTERLRALLPHGPAFSFRLRTHDDKTRLQVIVKDKYGVATPFGMRGTGVRRLTTLLVELLSHDMSDGHWYFLMDEPETSLHADSQHLLRRLLEELGDKDNVQVIYATHSPSMINPLRPHAIRLFQRATRKGKATSVVDNRPFKENYLPIRASLGLSPADSLLYAPITVVVEGDTEQVGIPLFLDKLWKANIPGFERWPEIGPQIHVLGGGGDNLQYFCRLAESQGAEPIVFVDGDKKRHLKKHGIDSAKMPVVELADGTEFEQLVPPPTYFQALAAVLTNDTRITEQAFRQWEQTQTLPAKMVFTKRVYRWLDDLDVPWQPEKAAVMRKAIELADPGSIDAKPFLELLRHCQHLLT